VFLETRASASFPLLRERVVYEGAHSGDWIAASESARLLDEAQNLRDTAIDPTIRSFAEDVIELTKASIATGNPVVF
jgi:hypothetical protein